MTVRSISFDDPSDDDLFVFSGSDLLIAHYNQIDLDWQEVAERTALDQRRGLVVLQVAVLEDLVDEFLLYLGDEHDQEAHRRRLNQQTIGVRLGQLERLLHEAGFHDDCSQQLLVDLRRVVDRRNDLVHGTTWPRLAPGNTWPPMDRNVEVEWVLTDRRTGATRRITMRELRDNLNEAAGAFSELLAYAEFFVERAPWPTNFGGGTYLSEPTP